MTVEFYNLSAKELQDLRDLENKYPNDFILKVTKKAFDGHEIVKIFIEALDIIVPIIELILLWKDVSDKRKKGNESESSEVEKAKIVVIYPDGKKFSVEMENASREALNSVLNTSNQREGV